MARLTVTGGFELNSAVDGVEALDIQGTPTIQTTVAHVGGRAAQIDINGADYFHFQFASADTSADHYAGFYLYIDTLPGADTVIGAFFNSVSNDSGFLLLSSTGALGLHDNSGGQIGSTTTLSTGQWYRIDHRYFNTSTTTTLRVDGVTIATSTSAFTETIRDYKVGANIDSNGDSALTGKIYIDDFGVNDTSGSAQNSWLGDRHMVLALPTGAGDNNPTTGDWSMINEIPPSDTATTGVTMIELDTTTSIGDFNVTDSSTLGIGSSDTINFVSVVARVREEASGTSNYALGIKSASGATVSETSLVDAGNTTVRTNPTTGNVGFLNRLIATTDPTTGVAWTATGTNSLDNMQIRVKTTDGAPDIWVTWMGAYIEYVPPSSITVTPPTASLTLTPFAPVIQHTIIAGLASLTLTTFAPTVTVAPAPANVTVTPSTASLTLSTFAPTVTATNHQTAIPGVASLTLTPFAPSVTATSNQTVTPGVASLTLSAFAPTVTATNNQVATPGVAALTLTPFAPTVSVSNNQLAIPGVANLAITTFAPTVAVTANQTVTPGVASLTLSTFAPTVSLPVTVTPTTASLTITRYAPQLQLAVIPPTAALTLSTFAPTVLLPKLVTPATASLNITAYAPVLKHTVIVPTATLTLSTYAPTVTATSNQTVTPNTLALVTSTFAPTVTTSDNKTATPGTASLTITSFAPTITTGANRVVTPGTAALTLTGLAPSVTATLHIIVVPGTAGLVIATFAPGVSVQRLFIATGDPTTGTFAPTSNGASGAFTPTTSSTGAFTPVSSSSGAFTPTVNGSSMSFTPTT